VVSKRVRGIGRSVGLGLLALLFLLPLFWMVSAAFIEPGSTLPTRLRLWPETFSMANYRRVFAIAPFGRLTLNSLLVAVIAVPLTIVTGSWAGFAISQLDRAWQRRWVLLSLAVLMVPGIALWSTRFLVFRWFGWLDSVWALVAPAWMGSSPFFVLMFYRAFRRIPRPIYDAALLEGAGVLAMWGRIAMPMARSTVLGVAFLSFVLYWGDFISPLLYISDSSRQTLPVGLQLLQQMTRGDWPLLMAGAVWATAIPLVLFFVVQFFMRDNGTA
jgi:multiple sugar transport system permease protein